MIEMRSIKAVGMPRPQLFVVNWNLGKRCNFECSYCPNDLHDKDSPHVDLAKLTLAFANILRAMDERGDRRGLRLEFTGGEPTMNPDFLRFVRWLKSEYGHVVQILGLTTNGSRPLGYYDRLIEIVDYITFSAHFEYMSPRLFLRVVLLTARAAKDPRRTTRKQISVNVMDEPWASERVLELLSILKTEGVFARRCRVRNHYGSVGLAVMNEGAFDYATFVREHGCAPPAAPDDPGADCDAAPEMMPDSVMQAPGQNALEAVSDPAARTQGYVEVHLEDGSKFWALPSSLIDGGLNQFHGWTCKTGWDSLHIYNDGTVYGSVCRAAPLGNVFEGFAIQPHPIRCPWTRCVCSSDIRIQKRLPHDHAASSSS